jgi:hypothetical protein
MLFRVALVTRKGGRSKMTKIHRSFLSRPFLRIAWFCLAAFYRHPLDALVEESLECRSCRRILKPRRSSS